MGSFDPKRLRAASIGAVVKKVLAGEFTPEEAAPAIAGRAGLVKNVQGGLENLVSGYSKEARGSALLDLAPLAHWFNGGLGAILIYEALEAREGLHAVGAQIGVLTRILESGTDPDPQTARDQAIDLTAEAHANGVDLHALGPQIPWEIQALEGDGDLDAVKSELRHLGQALQDAADLQGLGRVIGISAVRLSTPENLLAKLTEGLAAARGRIGEILEGQTQVERESVHLLLLGMRMDCVEASRKEGVHQAPLDATSLNVLGTDRAGEAKDAVLSVFRETAEALERVNREHGLRLGGTPDVLQITRGLLASAVFHNPRGAVQVMELLNDALNSVPGTALHPLLLDTSVAAEDRARRLPQLYQDHAVQDAAKALAVTAQKTMWNRFERVIRAAEGRLDETLACLEAGPESGDFERILVARRSHPLTKRQRFIGAFVKGGEHQAAWKIEAPPAGDSQVRTFTSAEWDPFSLRVLRTPQAPQARAALSRLILRTVGLSQEMNDQYAAYSEHVPGEKLTTTVDMLDLSGALLDPAVLSRSGGASQVLQLLVDVIKASEGSPLRPVWVDAGRAALKRLQPTLVERRDASLHEAAGRLEVALGLERIDAAEVMLDRLVRELESASQRLRDTLRCLRSPPGNKRSQEPHLYSARFQTADSEQSLPGRSTPVRIFGAYSSREAEEDWNSPFTGQEFKASTLGALGTDQALKARRALRGFIRGTDRLFDEIAGSYFERNGTPLHATFDLWTVITRMLSNPVFGDRKAAVQVMRLLADATRVVKHPVLCSLFQDFGKQALRRASELPHLQADPAVKKASKALSLALSRKSRAEPEGDSSVQQPPTEA